VWTVALAVWTLTVATPAWARFHLWDIQEVFSNEAGTIQFIELSTTSAGQQLLRGHGISVQDDTEILSQFDFLSNLAAGTANKSFLVGTQSLADLAGGVTPDYIIPAGFIDLADAILVDFAGVDTFLLAGLPLDGMNSLDRSGLSNTATPVNYAGETGIVPEPGTGLLMMTGLMGLALRRRRNARSFRIGAESVRVRPDLLVPGHRAIG
jgi:hypothetical protein